MPAINSKNQSPDWQQHPDYGALRQQLGWSDDFLTRCPWSNPRASISRLLHEKEWDQAIATGEAWLASCPVDIGVHLLTARALNAAGKHEAASNHVEWARGLTESIIASGDGRSADTAFVVISVQEEYDLLSVLGLSVKQQSLVSEGAKQLDLLRVETRSGSFHDIYFDPAAHFARLSRLLARERKQ